MIVQYQELPGKLVTLYPLDEKYIEQYMAMFSPNVRYALHVTNMASEKEYLYSCLAEMQAGKTIFYIISDIVTQQLIGAIAIRDPQLK